MTPITIELLFKKINLSKEANTLIECLDCLSRLDTSDFGDLKEDLANLFYECCKLYSSLDIDDVAVQSKIMEAYANIGGLFRNKEENIKGSCYLIYLLGILKDDNFNTILCEEDAPRIASIYDLFFNVQNIFGIFKDGKPFFPISKFLNEIIKRIDNNIDNLSNRDIILLSLSLRVFEKQDDEEAKGIIKTLSEKHNLKCIDYLSDKNLINRQFWGEDFKQNNTLVLITEKDNKCFIYIRNPRKDYFAGEENVDYETDSRNQPISYFVVKEIQNYQFIKFDEFMEKCVSGEEGALKFLFNTIISTNSYNVLNSNYIYKIGPEYYLTNQFCCGDKEIIFCGKKYPSNFLSFEKHFLKDYYVTNVWRNSFGMDFTFGLLCKLFNIYQIKAEIFISDIKSFSQSQLLSYWCEKSLDLDIIKRICDLFEKELLYSDPKNREQFKSKNLDECIFYPVAFELSDLICKRFKINDLAKNENVELTFNDDYFECSIDFINNLRLDYNDLMNSSNVMFNKDASINNKEELLLFNKLVLLNDNLINRNKGLWAENEIASIPNRLIMKLYSIMHLYVSSLCSDVLVDCKKTESNFDMRILNSLLFYRIRNLDKYDSLFDLLNRHHVINFKEMQLKEHFKKTSEGILFVPIESSNKNYSLIKAYRDYFYNDNKQSTNIFSSDSLKIVGGRFSLVKEDKEIKSIEIIVDNSLSGTKATRSLYALFNNLDNVMSYNCFDDKSVKKNYSLLDIVNMNGIKEISIYILAATEKALSVIKNYVINEIYDKTAVDKAVKFKVVCFRQVNTSSAVDKSTIELHNSLFKTKVDETIIGKYLVFREFNMTYFTIFDSLMCQTEKAIALFSRLDD